MDTILHSILGLVLLGIWFSLLWLLSPLLGAGAFVAFWIFTREVTQKQGSAYNDDIRYGWDFWNWSFSKNLETWVPILIVIATAISIQFIF